MPGVTHNRVTGDTPRAQSRRYVPDNSDGIDWGPAITRADAQCLSPELVMTPVGASGVTSAHRQANSAINWARQATEYEHQQRSGGMRAERLVLGSLGSTPEHHVPTALAHPMTEQLPPGCAEASVPMSDVEHLQSMRDMRDQTRVLASDLSVESVRMATLTEQSA